MVTKRAQDTNTILKTRLREALLDPSVVGMATSDIFRTFRNLGLSKLASEELTHKVATLLIKDNSLKETEDEVYSLFRQTNVNGRQFFDVLKGSLLDRERKIVGQVSPFLEGMEGKILDLGAGSGQIAQMLHDRHNLTMEAVDVSDFRSPGVTIPFLIFKGNRVPVPDGHYRAALLTNVMHHEANNEQILKELTRIVTKRLVIIETVPANETREEWERTFVIDTLWNRFFHYANIPVPGTYESTKDWVLRFNGYRWNLKYSEDLGYDQPNAIVLHHLLVFEK